MGIAEIEVIVIVAIAVISLTFWFLVTTNKIKKSKENKGFKWTI
jgi:uncharacterized protein with PQ loop repeat